MLGSYITTGGKDSDILRLPGGKYLNRCTILATHVGDFPCKENPLYTWDIKDTGLRLSTVVATKITKNPQDVCTHSYRSPGLDHTRSMNADVVRTIGLDIQWLASGWFFRISLATTALEYSVISKICNMKTRYYQSCAYTEKKRPFVIVLSFLRNGWATTYDAVSEETHASTANYGDMDKERAESSQK